MDSKKRKEKILKQLNKEQTPKSTSPANDMPTIKTRTPKAVSKKGNTIKGVTNPDAPKQPVEKEAKPTVKKAMYSNDKALKDENLLSKIAKEKGVYQRKQSGELNGVEKAFAKLKKLLRRCKNKIKSMSRDEKIKFFGAWAVVLVVICVIAGIASSGLKKSTVTSKKDDDTQQTDAVSSDASGDADEEAYVETNPMTECSIEGVNTLITSYLAALRDADVETLKSLDMCQDSYKSEKHYQDSASLIEDYQDVKVYVKNGPYENGYMAYVVTNIKFKDIDKTCQGMFQYVVRLQEDGSYKIDSTPEDDIDDDTVENAMITLSQSEDVLALIDSVNQQYEADLSADEKLKAFVDGNLQSDSSAEASAESTEAGTEATESAEAAENTDAEATTQALTE